MLIDGLQMMVGGGNVMRCGKVMVLAGRVALGVGHGALLAFSGIGKSQ